MHMPVCCSMDGGGLVGSEETLLSQGPKQKHDITMTRTITGSLNFVALPNSGVVAPAYIMTKNVYAQTCDNSLNTCREYAKFHPARE